jgi:hypothetical protein
LFRPSTSGFAAKKVVSSIMSLKGRTLFITGASRGIGLAIALRAARDGANIVIAAKTKDLDPGEPLAPTFFVPEEPPPPGVQVTAERWE